MKHAVIRHTIPSSSTGDMAVITPSPTNWWSIRLLELDVATSAVAGTRVHYFFVRDGPSIIATIANRGNQGANATRTHTWSVIGAAASQNTAGSGGEVSASTLFDRVWFPPGSSLVLRGYAIDPGDTHALRVCLDIEEHE